MKSGSFPENDAHEEAGDPVWQLLGRAPRPEPDGWFTARTLARCRNSVGGPEAAAESGRGLWRWALGMTLGVGLATLMITRISTEQMQDAQQKNVQEAFDIVASMDADADGDNANSTPPASWQDSSL
jgi:hypothetical protein